MAESGETSAVPKDPEPQDLSQVSQATEIVEGQPPPPADQFSALQGHLHDHPYDTAAWQDFVNIAEDSGDPAKISTAYDSLLKVYPNTVSSLSHKQPVRLKSNNASTRVDFTLLKGVHVM